MKHPIAEDNAKETSRVEAFSDGVFAIAITLLVLELAETLHNADKTDILHSFLHHWQSLFAFVVGFITILVCWINHHAAFESIRKVDTNLMWINGFLLFPVTLTPIPTAILAGYLEKESTTALSIYGFNYIMISIAAFGICAYAYNRQFIKPEQREFYYFYKLLYGYAIIYNSIAFALCFVSVVVPIIMYVILFMVFAAPKKFALLLSTRKKKYVKKQGHRP